jgi:hypothetical protein
MASDRQMEANRLNAQASTGPRTDEGKAASSRNALTHGLTARAGLLAGEAPEAFRRLRQDLITELRPEDALELELAEQIVSLLWRLRRVPAFEAALLAYREADVKNWGYSLIRPCNGRSEEQVQQLVLGKTIESFLQYDLSGKLSRYETSMQRRLSALLKDLRVMQLRRKEVADGE